MPSPIAYNLRTEVHGQLGTNQDVVNFRQLMTGGKRAPGLPKFDPNRGVRPDRAVLCVQATLTSRDFTGAR